MLKDALMTDVASCLDSPGFMFRDTFLLVIHEVMVANDDRWTLLYIPEAESDQGEGAGSPPRAAARQTKRDQKDTRETILILKLKHLNTLDNYK